MYFRSYLSSKIDAPKQSQSLVDTNKDEPSTSSWDIPSFFLKQNASILDQGFANGKNMSVQVQMHIAQIII